MINNCIPRPEYPRPQFARDKWVSLNGEWQFERDKELTGVDRRLYEASSLAERITVPFCMESVLSGIGDTEFCRRVWYLKKVDISKEWLSDSKRVILNIGACDYCTRIYVNGQKMGKHIGGYSSFSVDITSALTVGENTIVISVDDDLLTCAQPSGKQSDKPESYECFYTRTTGIWQTVWLESVPAEYISKVKFTTDNHTKTLSISARVMARDGALLTAKAYWNGREVGQGAGKVLFGNAQLTIMLSELHTWELGSGGLYDLELCLGEDIVKSYFGMRDLTLDDTAIVLNGKKVFQRLVLDQGFYPDGICTAKTEQELIDDITRSMACGFNGARLHQKVFEPLFLYHCDRLGYMVWGEHASFGLIESGDAYKGFISEWSEIVERDINHPSIIGWCPFNETQRLGKQDNDLIRAVFELTRRLDPTRPIIDASGWLHVDYITDIMDWHDYDQNPESFRKRYEAVANGELLFNDWRLPNPISPRFISEYGGIKWDVASGLGDAWGYGDAPKTEEEFLERFKGLTEALLFNPYITGFCYTQLTDVEQETNGLYTYDRKEKFDTSYFYKILTQKAAIED
ncbi:MAG: beta-galactosidase [Clostridia bacterium]|nr:beta-galactosidase [Clostridia bacterium]